MHKHKLATWLTCIALAAGIASAAALESLEIGLPSGPSVSVDAVLVPGADGSDISLSSGVGWIDEIDFNIDPDGTILVGGEAVGTTSVGNVHSVHIVVDETPTGYVASFTVTDEDLGLVVATGSGVELGVAAPVNARARGQSVISLSAE